MSTIRQLGTLSGKESFALLAKKEGADQDKIDTFLLALETIETIADKKVRPNIMDWDEQGATLVDGRAVLPGNMEAALTEIIKDNQLYYFFIPENLGGGGYSNTAMAVLTETLAQYDIGFQVLTFISLSVLEALVFYHKEEYNPIIENFNRGKYIGYVGFTEAQAGSNLENVMTTSVLEGDEYVINGTKIFISNGGYAECGLVLTKNMVNGKMDGHNVFVVDGLEGVITERLEHKSGLRANPTAQLFFDNVRVPKEHMIAEPGKGYKKVLERLMAMRIGVTFQGIGASMRAYDLAKQYSEERTQFGKPISSFTGVSKKLKEMERTIPRMRAHGYYASMALDRYYKGYMPMEVGATGVESEKMAANALPGSVRGGLAHYFVSNAKMYTSELSNMIAYDAQQIFGGNGFIAEYEVNKIARDVRVLPVYEGTSEIHEWIITRAQDAVNLIPSSKFPKMTSAWEERTLYDKMLYLKFPDLEGKI